MRRAALLAALLWQAPCWAQQQEVDQAIQRALIQRDQQSAEFAAQIRGQDPAALRSLHERQLLEAQQPMAADPALARQLLPYQRLRMAEESVLRLPPPVIRTPSLEPPLPLPGRPKPLVEPIAPSGFNG